MAAKVAKNKKVLNATPTTVGEVKFKSKAEAAFWQRCRERGLVVRYEEYTLTLMDKFRYPDGSKAGELCRPITWTPDFTDPRLRFVVEVKGFADKAFPLKLKLAKQQWLALERPPEYVQVKNIGHARLMADYLADKYL